MNRALWWFLLTNNLIILALFISSMIQRELLIIGDLRKPGSWRSEFESVGQWIGIVPFVLSLIYLIYKVSQPTDKDRKKLLDNEG